MLENTEGAIKHGQSRETGKIGHTRRRQTKQKHNTIWVGHHYKHEETVDRFRTVRETHELFIYFF